jgi:hypothetical protein
MDQPVLPNLPRHVLERVERRWAAVLSYQSTLRPEKKFLRMQEPSPDRQPPESGPPSAMMRRPASSAT